MHGSWRLSASELCVDTLTSRCAEIPRPALSSRTGDFPSCSRYCACGVLGDVACALHTRFDWRPTDAEIAGDCNAPRLRSYVRRSSIPPPPPRIKYLAASMHG